MDSLDYIRNYYGVPAYKDSWIEYSGDPAGPRQGKIVGASGPHLLVQLVGYPEPVPMHPTWNVIYLRDHEVTADV